MLFQLWENVEKKASVKSCVFYCWLRAHWLKEAFSFVASKTSSWHSFVFLTRGGVGAKIVYHARTSQKHKKQLEAPRACRVTTRHSQIVEDAHTSTETQRKYVLASRNVYTTKGKSTQSVILLPILNHMLFTFEVLVSLSYFALYEEMFSYITAELLKMGDDELELVPSSDYEC